LALKFGTFNILTLKDFAACRQVPCLPHGACHTGPATRGLSRLARLSRTVDGVTDRHPADPIAEARRQWSVRWPEQADHMAAVTSIMRAQQILLAKVEDVLKPYALTFAAYEALRLLAFSRSGSLPMGKMGTRLMVHPAAVTNAIARLEQRGLVQRQMSPEDRRVVLAGITPAGRTLAEEATDALNQAAFGLPGLSQEQAAQVTAMLYLIRASTGDV
jgi:DNA-binding MarR family transcriptional regulator